MERMFGFRTVFVLLYCIATGAFIVLGKERIYLLEIKMRCWLTANLFSYFVITILPRTHGEDQIPYGSACACVASPNLMYSTAHNETCGQCRNKLSVEAHMLFIGW
jgi:hypothetical protein